MYCFLKAKKYQCMSNLDNEILQLSSCYFVHSRQQVLDQNATFGIHICLEGTFLERRIYYHTIKMNNSDSCVGPFHVKTGCSSVKFFHFYERNLLFFFKRQQISCSKLVILQSRQRRQQRPLNQALYVLQTYFRISIQPILIQNKILTK